MHRANEIQPVMKRLGHMVEKYGCAIILIGHMNKASGSKSTYRGLGSIDFQATARSVLIVGRVKDNNAVRVITHDKSSLAPEGASIAFRLDKENGFSWEGIYDISVDNRGQKMRDAKAFLSEKLGDGQVSCNEIMEAASQWDQTENTAERQKRNEHCQ